MWTRSLSQVARASGRISQAQNSRFSSSLASSTASQSFARHAPRTSYQLQHLTRRQYSDAAPAPEQKSAEAAAESKESAQASNADGEALKKDLEAKNKEVIDLKDKYLRSVADFRNLQERTKREVQTARDFALQKFAKDLLASIDNLDHALRAVPKERVATAPSDEAAKEVHKDLVNLHQGLEMVESVLLSTLKRHGVTRFDPALESDVFDPNLHEAVFMAPQPDKKDNTVFHTQQKGFMLNGRILRAAQVGVVKNS